MDIFTTEQLKRLYSVEDTCVSLYMPTFRAGLELQQNPLRFKNLIIKAQQQLIDYGIRPTVAESMLEPARKTLLNGFFWQHLSDGLAMFITPQSTDLFRLPHQFEELTHAGSKFHLKPLIPLLSGDTTFYLLTLDIKGPHLYKGNRFSFEKVESELMPMGLDETLGFDTSEKQVQFASRPSQTSDNPVTVFGYGRHTDKTKVNILNFFHRVNDAVRKILNKSKAPLITMGVEQHIPIYREANTYPYLLEQAIPKSPENMPLSQLHSLAWNEVLPHFEETELRLTRLYKQLKGEESPMIVEDVKEIVTDAVHGRVETLFILDGKAHLWGKIREEQLSEIEIHDNQQPGDEDLLETAALNTMFKGGVVFMIKPEQVVAPSPAAAILRF
ncbi:hypothetical protein CHISP_0771 [Chitinispirillum alkaliphilum]|nr:hypothetical protein CHISP_0771 [Chitinispirillum alkaliphilum]